MIKRQFVKALVIGGVAVIPLSQALFANATFDYTNTFSGVQTELTAALTAIVPAVVVVFALLLGVRLAFTLFRRFGSKA